MLIKFVIILTAIFNNSHGKHVNLLRDNQKQQLLDKIDGRVMKSVGSTENGHLFGREITEEMIEQDILHTRKHRADYSSSEDDNNNDDNLDINSDNSDKTYTGTSEDSGLDISEIKRRSHINSVQESITNSKKVETITENSTLKTSIKIIDISNVSKPVDTLFKTINTEEDLTIDNSIDKKTNYTTFYETKRSRDERNFDIQSENVTNNSAKGILLLDVDNFNITTAKIYDKNEPQNQKKPSVSNHKSTENHSLEESYNTNVQKNFKRGPIYPYYKTNNNMSTDVTSKGSIFIDLNEYSPPSPKYMINILTTTILPALSSSNIQKHTSNTWKQKRFHKIVRPLTEFEDKAKHPMINVKYDVTTEKKASVGSYQVYEIPWPDSSGSPPFLKSAEPIKHSPFPVPTYKFSLNYAHYNPDYSIKLHSNDKSSEKYDTFATKVKTNGNKFEFVTPHSVQDRNINNDLANRREWLDDYVEAAEESKRLADKVKKKKDAKNKLNSISKIISITDAADVFPTLEKLQTLNNVQMRRNDDVTVSIYLKVLKDLIEQNNTALKRYDWLATTVQIQSALSKLFLLIKNLSESKPIHPADIEILKYVIFLHNLSSDLKEKNNIISELRHKKKNLLPRNQKNKGAKLLKVNKVWLIRTLLSKPTSRDGLNSLYEFLLDVENALFDLHEAITQLSKITKFKQQYWFENLKQLYLTSNEKHLRELLLHISISRMVDLIEQSCENGLEDDYIGFMTSHKKETKRTLEEMVFVLNILDDIKISLD